MNYRGLTWDHPRGRAALEAAADSTRSDTFSIHWDVHSLEGFESSSIDELADRYDLIVLDHPHLGDALATGSLLALDEVFTPAEIDAWAADSVGPSMPSYRMAGHLWALPLDAAAQVSARRADLVPHAPETWSDVLALAADVPVALSLAGPHALMSFCSLAVSLGEEPTGSPSEGRFVSRAVGREALRILGTLSASAPAGMAALNPIAMLEALSTGDSIAYCPLIYGYVNYSTVGRQPRVSFGDAPVALPGGRPGSTIGGTGIAISRRAVVTPELLTHLRWLMSDDAQASFIPLHEGQPSSRTAWTDPAVDDASGHFYRDTLATLEQSWVRPRYLGYTGFQSAASALLREALTTDGGESAQLASAVDPDRVLDALDDLHRRHSVAEPTNADLSATDSGARS